MDYDVKSHLHQILDTLPQGVRLVAISKYHPNEYIEAAYEEGQRVFGEPYVSMIEAVDSLKLLKEINRQAEKCGRVINVLLELHIAEEATKYGLTLDACRELLKAGEWHSMSHVRICGLMMMASNVDDEDQIRREMQTAADFFDEIKEKYFANDDAFRERSWGMSDDYLIAVETHSTMVRIGTSIFGPRVY